MGTATGWKLFCANEKNSEKLQIILILNEIINFLSQIVWIKIEMNKIEKSNIENIKSVDQKNDHFSPNIPWLVSM